MVVLAHSQGEEVGVDVDQLGEETEARRVTVSDRTLASVGPACPVSGSNEHTVSVS